jgi:UDP-N-acetylmuramoyl-L-alanyl-D-glutamate--2,6-diaminopimelate ligase
MRVSVKEIKAALAKQGLLVSASNDLPDQATGISDDSRKVSPGDLFIAVRGWNSDGHDFLDAAREKGASLAIVEDPSRTTLPSLVVREGRRAAGVLVGSEGEVLPGGSGLTTPGPVELQRILRALADRGVRSIAMEVSSHSLDQRRIDGLEFDVAVFTNLTRDHLDYHGTMEKYFAAKARLLGYLKSEGTAVLNADAPEWRSLETSSQTLTFGVGESADIQAEDVRFTSEGSEWRLVTPRGSADVSLPLIGDINVENALAAAAAAVALGQEPAVIAVRLGTVPQVAGRLEIISRRPTVLRDYAHTPDALERTLKTARAFTRGKLIVVFGCGGDRDKGKRPLMGEIAERDADCAIVTSDNPRTEDPDAIIDDIEAGMRNSKHERVTDRLSAIQRAIDLAEDGDIVLLAGKGHETYQIRGTTSYPFDEKEIVKEMTGSHA